MQESLQEVDQVVNFWNDCGSGKMRDLSLEGYVTLRSTFVQRVSHIRCKKKMLHETLPTATHVAGFMAIGDN